MQRYDQFLQNRPLEQGKSGTRIEPVADGMGVNQEQVKLERDLDDLRDAVLNDWVRITTHSAGAARAMQSSLSWRITRPLRLFRTYQFKAREVGSLEATRLALALVKDKVRGR